ncbi:MAG: acylphosphatase, partial [Proteobacteria bacterium]
MSPAPERRCIMVRISGVVQGVGFREWTRQEALKLGLEGWVRNQPDGSVKAVIVGNSAAVSAMLEAFMHGPR